MARRKVYRVKRKNYGNYYIVCKATPPYGHGRKYIAAVRDSRIGSPMDRLPASCRDLMTIRAKSMAEAKRIYKRS